MRTRRNHLFASLLLPVLIVAAGCGSDKKESGSAATTTAASVTSTSEASVTTEAPTTTLAAPVGAATAEEAARMLYAAWEADDRAAASVVADPVAIDSMWTAAKGPYELYRHCDDGEFDTGGCLFRDRSTNHTIQIDLEKRNGQWVVSGTFYSEE